VRVLVERVLAWSGLKEALTGDCIGSLLIVVEK
jgi:hypothetical protein